MGEETIQGILRSLGLTDKEAEVYIFLSKHGILKCREISKGMKRHTAQIYRILKILLSKGLLESTLEAPLRFKAVPFETVLDLSIKAKRNEAAQIEKTKNEILSYWKSIRQPELGPSLEKFVVIEGDGKIYPKIVQMTKETKNHLSVVATVPSLLRADQFDLFETILNHPLKSKIAFRFLTDSSAQNVNVLKTFLKKMPSTMLRFGGGSQETGLPLSPRMVLRDSEEALFFVTPRNGTSGAEKEDVCLWTNCKELVLAFACTFEDLWKRAPDMGKKLPAENSKPGTAPVKDKESEGRYDEALRSADEEIMRLPSMEQVEERVQHYARTMEPVMAYGWRASAIIRLPNLPETPIIGINVIHLDDNSAFGGGKMIEFASWMKTPTGHSFVPVACLVNAQGAMVMKHFYGGTPAEHNLVLVEPHKQAEIFRKDRLVFAGWTVNVPLPPLNYNLEPSCLYFEGHGPIQQVTRSYSVPAGFKGTTEFKKCHAFVTFMNQSTAYVERGVQGFLVTEYVMRTTPS
jgi:sugar-specific transcriptional regulator TrmB